MASHTDLFLSGTLNLGLICKMHCIKTVSLAPPYGQSQKFPNVK